MAKKTSSPLEGRTNLPLNKAPPASKKVPTKKNGSGSPTKKKGSASSKSSGCTKEMLCAVIAQVSSLHNGMGAPKEMVAKRAGYGGNPKGSAFAVAISRQSKNGYIRVDGGLLYLTESGQELAGQANIDDLPVDNTAQLDKIEQSLSAKKRELFVLLRQSSKPMMKVDLASALGYESATVPAFSVLVSRVKTDGYLEDAPGCKAAVQLSNLCFPYGRP